MFSGSGRDVWTSGGKVNAKGSSDFTPETPTASTLSSATSHNDDIVTLIYGGGGGGAGRESHCYLMIMMSQKHNKRITKLDTSHTPFIYVGIH